MALYRMEAKIIGRSDGRSATGAAAYRAGIVMKDERTGLVHDYSRKQGILHTEIMTPDNAPSWMRDRTQLWNAVEKAEKRKDAQLARELMVALPHELTDEQRLELVREFVRAECVNKGMIADIAVHAPSAHDKADERNFHAHILLSTRELLGEGFGNKERAWNDRKVLEDWRRAWAEHQNRSFEKLGLSVRVDHRSLEDQGILRKPTRHLGPIATEIERSGRQSHVGNDNRKTENYNGKLADLQSAGNAIDAKMLFEQRKFEVWKERKRDALQLDQEQKRAQFQVGLAARMAALENQLEADFGEEKAGLSLRHDKVATRLEVRGWRKFIRDITFMTRRDKTQLEQLEARQAELRKAEEDKRIQHEASEKARIANIRAMQAGQSDKLERGLSKAEKRREDTGWAPLPPDFKKAGGPPKAHVKPEFDLAKNKMPDQADRDAGSGESSGTSQKIPDPQKELADKLRSQRDSSGQDRTAEKPPAPNQPAQNVNESVPDPQEKMAERLREERDQAQENQADLDKDRGHDD